MGDSFARDPTEGARVTQILATRIALGPAGAAAATFQLSSATRHSFDQVTADLRAAIVAKDLWLLQEIDPQALLRREGIEIRRAVQFLFFHPRLMRRLLEADSAAVVEAPLKVAVLDISDTEVMVRCVDPGSAFARYENPALVVLGLELRVICREILRQASGEVGP